MDVSAPTDGVPISPFLPEEMARAVAAEIERDLGVLTRLLGVGGAAMDVFERRLRGGEETNPAKAFAQLSRAVRRTLALKMRLRQEQMAALRGQFRPPAPVAAKPPAGAAGAGAAAAEPRPVNLLGDLYDRADPAEDGSEIGDTPSVEVYRAVCRDLGLKPDEAAFTRSSPSVAPEAAPAMASAAVTGAAVAGAAVAAPRFRPPDAGRGPDWAVRMGSGRDPPRGA